jgi:hypothetical protein
VSGRRLGLVVQAQEFEVREVFLAAAGPLVLLGIGSDRER